MHGAPQLVLADKSCLTDTTVSYGVLHGDFVYVSLSSAALDPRTIYPTASSSLSTHALFAN